MCSKSVQWYFFVSLCTLLYFGPFQSRVASAQLPPPTLFMTPTSHDGQVQSKQIVDNFQRTFIDYINKSKRIKYLDEKSKSKNPNAEIDSRVAQAESYKHTALESFKAGKYEEAQKTLLTSLKLYKMGVSGIRSFKAVRDTLIYLGASYTELGFNGDAKDYYRQLAAIAPADYEPPTQISDKAKKKFKRELKRVLKKRGALTIKTIPTGAKVMVDGVEHCVDQNPCKVKNLPRGLHYVQVSKAGVGRNGSVFEVKAGWEKEIEYDLSAPQMVEQQDTLSPMVLKTINEKMAQGLIDAQFRNQADQVGNFKEADFILTSHLMSQGRQVHLFSYLYGVNSKRTVSLGMTSFKASLSGVRVISMRMIRTLEQAIKTFETSTAIDGQDPEFSLIVKAQVAEREAVKKAKKKNRTLVAKNKVKAKKARKVDAKKSALLNSALLPSKKTKTVKKETKKKAAWYKSPWIWVGVGTVVAGGAVGGYMLYQNSIQNPQYQTEVVW